MTGVPSWMMYPEEGDKVEEECIRQAVENVIEKRHGFPAGCGYVDAWTEHEREAITTSFLKVDKLIAHAQDVARNRGPLAGFVALFVRLPDWAILTRAKEKS